MENMRRKKTANLSMPLGADINQNTILFSEQVFNVCSQLE